MYVLLIYDIPLDNKGARVSRNIFKICKKYLTHVQKSVFEGELTPGKLKQLEMELKEYIRPEIDSVVVFKSRQKKWLDKEFWGIDESHLTSNIF
ncbi:CRISPR-associated endonuclease Cas2 [Vagococcus lutrae]|uniref:CRISPR-associated endonuclease Cas2 n=1 Tax=Vagococcus TaxID=2737 RepID=UPI000EE5E2C2|nr:MULTISPECIES: CRISPR-associated endonuclease Cas2 [Vagococcus]MCO7151946.1 CRISPR-associated endonuclease Cas2 [Vagococcus lutrae]MDT2812713.1 CRISPR-associated endonuclease Cas2 [Vagococcus lutrae]MDT2819317.1 CRISPR-associated endonuclease Cas2 [Vagococcus lutrae]MDT2844130.1 CRISPR-associated endonuclease Cas2 [Vagococcus lutrae]WCG05721.1 CRISPR-associated endonuclease Cas2 [Vagococcus lutrae]